MKKKKSTDVFDMKPLTEADLLSQAPPGVICWGIEFHINNSKTMEELKKAWINHEADLRALPPMFLKKMTALKDAAKERFYSEKK